MTNDQPSGASAPQIKIVDKKVEPFVHAHYESLDECALAPGAWSYYASGRTLAFLHRIHLLHGDWRPEAYGFDTATGAVTPMLLSKGAIAADAPAVRAADFKTPHSVLDADAFHGLLAGYVNQCWQDIEPDRPGYVDGMLSALGVTVTRMDRPRETFVKAEALMRKLGLEVTVTESGVALRGVPGDVSLSVLDDSPGDSLVLLAGLACAGLDVTALARHEKLRSLSTDMGRHIALLIDHLAGRKPVELDSAYGSHYEGVCMVYFAHLQKAFGYPADKPPEGRMAEMQLMQGMLTQSDAEVRDAMLGSMVDIADYVAAKAAIVESKAGMDRRHSQSAAHRSLLMSFMLGRAGLLDEPSMLTMLQRHGRAGWRPAGKAKAGKADADETSELDDLPLLPFFGAIVYLQTKGSIFKQRFEQSMHQDSGQRNLRWSYAWHALAIYRSTTQAISRRTSHWSTRRKWAAQMDGLLKMTVSSYGGTLAAYAKGLQSLVDRMKAGMPVAVPENFPSKCELTMHELKAAAEFLECIGKGSVKRRKIRNALQQLVDAGLRSTAKY